jgi:hypothetical protein
MLFKPLKNYEMIPELLSPNRRLSRVERDFLREQAPDLLAKIQEADREVTAALKPVGTALSGQSGSVRLSRGGLGTA